MVIRTEYRGTRYCMGSSDPLPAGFEIRFGGLNFQATGNGSTAVMSRPSLLTRLDGALDRPLEARGCSMTC
jgi:hypothetical protein